MIGFLLPLLCLVVLCYKVKDPIFIKVRNMHVVGFSAFPFIVLNLSELLHPLTDSASLVEHEKIHFEQQRELLIIGAFLIFWTEYSIRYLLMHKKHSAKEIRLRVSFEREALENQRTPDYLKNRKRYAWVKYIL